MFRVLYFFSEHFFTILMGNNNKLTENDVRMVWVQKQVIMCCFANYASFQTHWLKLLTVIFISHIDAKQQQNYWKLCAKDLGQKCSYLGLVSIFGRLFCLGSCTFVLSIFLTILIGNTNKMTENDVSMVWVQNFGSFRANWLKRLIFIFISRTDGKQQ